MYDPQTTATDQKLGNGPADMPDRGKGGKGAVQSSSETCSLGRSGIPVANLTNKPRNGEFQTGSSAMSPLGRSATSPYDPDNATVPRTSFGGGKRKAR